VAGETRCDREKPVEKLDDAIEQILEKCRSDRPAPCQAACPLHIDVRQYVRLISEKKFKEALRVVRATLPFPDIIGRTCTHPCEPACRRKDVDSPIQICALKRFVTGYSCNDYPSPGEPKHRDIAIVGGGPAGLMAAHDLRLLGYGVTMFEAEACLGGMLLAAIPEFRLPRDIVLRELALIHRLGITVHLGTRVGADVSLDQLKKRFSAIFLAPGQSLSKKLGLPGEAAQGVHQGLSFLKSVKLGEKIEIGKKAVVIGGGNVAIDAARTAWRLGAEKVTILYRRSRAEIPAASDEVEEAEREGIDIRYLSLPEKIVAKAGRVAAIEYARAELGPPDDRGRKTPLRAPGPTSLIEADTLIIAVGQTVDSALLSGSFGPSADATGELMVDSVTLATQVAGIFAGGDALGEEATIVAALAAGRKAALSIDQYVSSPTCAPVSEEADRRYRTPLVKSIEGVVRQERETPPRLAVAERQGNFDEVMHVFSEEEAVREASRCLDCRCVSCITDCEFLTKHNIFPKQLAETAKGAAAGGLEISYSCNVCGLCKTVCPEGIDTGDFCLKIRERLVDEGKGPLPGHQPVDLTQQFVNSDAFRFIHPDPRTGTCRSLFFPGCSLSGYSSSLVLKTYAYLLERMDNVGILLGCCGAPRHLLGEHETFVRILDELEDDMKKLGAQELIVACPDCCNTLETSGRKIHVRSVYEVITELGLPERKKDKERTFSLHDSCTARDLKNLRESVRLLIEKMGYTIQESPYSGELARCCGTGGLLPYADFDLAARATKRRIDEFRFDIVTYCAACRETFALEKPSLHLLDLVFNPEWMEARNGLPKSGKKKRQTQSETRFAIVDFIEKEKRKRG
jgi:NADPH-dependent glutamate synthase beta subunit-like oxidoreductase